MSGANTTNQTGTYGSLGVANASNVPGSRYGALAGIENDNLWLFGGQVAVSTRVNDLWKYNITANQWTWISGSNLTNQNGIYGALGVANATNVPGARQAGIAWIDGSNNFWMQGGDGNPANGSNGYLNDLWKYNSTANQWTWVKGSDTISQFANYGIQGVSSSTNIPGARQMSISGKDANGDFWLFGAWGFIPPFGRINDLWKYELATNEYTWIAGDNDTNQIGVYGTIGVGSTSNIPGARRMSISWIDSVGNFWLFGGNMTDGAGGSLLLNDLWKISISGNVGIELSKTENIFINVFQNPAIEFINVEISNAEEQTIEIVDLMGKSIYQNSILKNKCIDISNFPKGIYFIRIGSQTKKLIK